MLNNLLSETNVAIENIKSLRSLKWLSMTVLIGVASFLAACQSATAPSPTEGSLMEATTGPTIFDDLMSQEQASPRESEGLEEETQEPSQQVDDPEPAEISNLEIIKSSIELDASGIQVGFTSDGHAFRGDPNAPIILEEYSDFQCPFCSRFVDETLPTIEAEQIASGDVVLVYYDFPLNNIHPQAAAAANAARCAGEQGAVAYWLMHDQLFANPEFWSNQAYEEAFVSMAEEIGIDTSVFKSCVQSNKYEKEVQVDLDAGVALGVSGTRSFFINGQLFVGAQPLAVFNEALTTVKEGGQLASNNPSEPAEPAAAPTPASLNQDFAGEMGDPNAPVTIVEFTDYQCPFCARHSIDTMPILVSEMIDSGRVHYMLKDLPLDQLHPDARSAATAARCAGDQGAYWEMHDIIFANQESWAGLGPETEGVFLGFAAELRLDTEEYADCMVSGRFDSAIENNVNEARALGVDGTPFFFVDGYPLSGARPTEHFQIAVELAEEGRLAEAFAPPPQAEPQPPSGPVEVTIGDAYVLGDIDAPVTIVEFTDFQCPFCSRHYQQTFPQIIDSYVNEGLVRYVFKDFPLNSIHPQAFAAAEAARCAGDQDAFLEMHNLLFDRQGDWGNQEPTDTFIGYAGDLGLDTDQFGVCLSSGKYSEAVNADLQQGMELGVTGTPAFFLNGHLVSGAQPYELFVQAIESLISEDGS
jgi:protein-disulfide isomerase